MLKHTSCFCFAIGLALFLATWGPAYAGPQAPKISPPSQPASGPGGAEYSHQKVLKSKYGSGDTEYWLYEPADPEPGSAPVVIFLHGWSAVNPQAYGAWIEHLVRRGNIVIFPRYQESVRTPVQNFTGNTLAALAAAFKELQAGKHVRPQTDKVAVVGHSMGGELSSSVAALAGSRGLPVPRAVMSVEPGKTWTRSKRIAFPLEDLSKVDPSTLLLAVAGEEDHLAKDVDAKRIYKETTAIPPANKNYIVFLSDSHGKPALKASHHAPVAIDPAYDSGEKRSGGRTGQKEGARGGKLRERLKERLKEKLIEQAGDEVLNEDGTLDPESVMGLSVNALDYYGYWKLLDGLCDAAFYGKNREYALGNTPQQRYMGKWSDGVPVKELKIMNP